ncbi:hypothetical protein HOY80DRAFT_1102582 [Tuber brumale]|nr:hypothetical protein HOY80DRAFT_1102582 [Tuber brumale]
MAFFILGEDGWVILSSTVITVALVHTVLRLLNVSKSFQISDGSASFFRTEKVPGIVHGVRDAAFFPTESGLEIAFGVWVPYNSTIFGNRSAPIENRKWQYEIATRQWTNTGITLINWFQENSPKRISSSMTAWIPSLKKGFLFGGSFFSINVTSLTVEEREEHAGLITYDQATNTWTNETTELVGVTGGALVHITTATDEVLIQFGGRSEWSTRVRPFSEINIYSMNRSKWYTQHLPLGAEVPDPRFAFCTALKSASDGSSHQIYIMGGLEPRTSVDAWGGPTATSVWVLSIPSLEWALLPVASKTTAKDPGRRYSPKCQAIGEHYIFYYGGASAMSSSDATIRCDKKANAAFLFDINTLTWIDEFTPNEGTYEIPSKVLELIGGDKSGRSTKKAPTKGWSDPDLEAIMKLKTTTTPTKTPSRSGSSSDPSKTNVGAIAGGTVAGIVAGVLGFLGAIMFCRRRQKSRVRTAELP